MLDLREVFMGAGNDADVVIIVDKEGSLLERLRNIFSGGEEYPTLDQIDKAYIRLVLEMQNWKQKTAAKVLGMSRWALKRRITKYEIRIPNLTA